MNDLDHYMGGDVGIGATADVNVTSALTASNQRVLRRLLTNPGDYMWHPTYGAGLPAEVGKLADERRIKGTIQSQLFLESVVLRTPPPVITVVMQTTTVSVRIQYADAQTGQVSTLAFDINK